MGNRLSLGRSKFSWKGIQTPYLGILLLSVILQLTLGIYLGHYYDTRLFMATGYLVSSGQNPYIPQDLTAVFQNPTFQDMTSIGYFPPWALVLGVLYRVVQVGMPNLLLYNLVIKIPVIAANIALAYLVAGMLRILGSTEAVIRRAWTFMLLSPFVLYFAAAWGQFDAVVAMLSLLALISLEKEKIKLSAVLLALAVAFKPIALPIFPVALLYQLGRSSRAIWVYAAWFSASLFLACGLPFLLFGWDPTPILLGWNAHFVVGGAMSYMTFYELLRDTYQLPGNWWLLGLAWIPALGVAVYLLRKGIMDFTDLLQKGLGMVLIFYLTRTWLSEPNLMLILPLALILTSIGRLNRAAFHLLWILPLVFTLFNASPPQLLGINFPQSMETLLSWLEEYRTPRLVARTALIIPWQILGWWIVATCFRNAPSQAAVEGGNLVPSQS